VRIAVLADVHGNLAAFEAALAAARAASPDLVVVAGDVVNGGPDSRACWTLARAEADLLLRGNHERYAIDRGTAAGDPAWTGPRFGPLVWTAAELDGLVDDVRRAPIAAPAADGVTVVHAAFADDQWSAFPWTSDDEVEAMFAGADGRLLVRGHNHMPFHRTLPDGRLLVSVGAVGLALSGRPEAQWALLSRHRDGWRVRHASEPYDVDATLRRFDESGYLEVAGPIGRLYRREMATGTHQLVPFLRFERAWRAEHPRAEGEDEAAALAVALLAFLDAGG
jgi:predicted phosphodiesterase